MRSFEPSKKQAIGIAQALKAMFKELEGMATKTLLEVVPDDEKDHVYVSIGQSKKNQLLADVRLYNGATKAIVVKSYTIIDLLRECSDLFLVNAMVDSDMRKLYKASKEKVFKKDTEVFI
jgi:hypothetical protein